MTITGVVLPTAFSARVAVVGLEAAKAGLLAAVAVKVCAKLLPLSSVAVTVMVAVALSVAPPGTSRVITLLVELTVGVLTTAVSLLLAEKLRLASLVSVSVK